MFFSKSKVYCIYDKHFIIKVKVKNNKVVDYRIKPYCI